MESKNGNYEGSSTQRPPLLEVDNFCHWKLRFQIYVCAIDIDLWDRIELGDYVPTTWSFVDKSLLNIPKENWTNDHKVQVSKNYRAKLILYNALPKREFERVYMCNSAKEIWDTLIFTHQGNIQMVENKGELLDDQNKSLSTLEDEILDVGCCKFNICTSLKAIGTSFTPKKYVKKILKDLPLKWRSKMNEAILEKDEEKCLMALGEIDDAWSVCEDEDNDLCLVGLNDEEVLSDSYFCFDELEHDYKKFVNLSEKVSKKNRSLKLENKSLKEEIEKQKQLVASSTKVVQKGKTHACLSCENVELKNNKLLNKIVILEKQICVSKSEEILNDIIKSQKSSHDKSGMSLSHEVSKASTSGTKPIMIVEQQKKSVGQNLNKSISNTLVFPNLTKGQRDKFYVSKKLEKQQVIKRFYTQTSNLGGAFSNGQNNLSIRRRPSQNYNSNNLNGKRYNNRHVNYNHQRKSRYYSQNIRLVQRWVRIGIFDANNPGPMRHWVPSS